MFAFIITPTEMVGSAIAGVVGICMFVGALTMPIPEALEPSPDPLPYRALLSGPAPFDWADDDTIGAL